MTSTINTITSSPVFGIFITIFFFILATTIGKKLRSPLANPLLVTTLLIAGFMFIISMNYSQYMEGGVFIDMMIGPATALLGLNVYRKRKIIGDNFLPIIIGSIGGSICSIASTYLLCTVLGIDNTILLSLLPKSVTTAIAIDLSLMLGGLKSITALSVIICGIFGAIINPFLVKILGIKNAVAIGVGMGTASHAIGTARALEMGEIEGAISSVSMCVAGIFTVFVLVLF